MCAHTIPGSVSDSSEAGPIQMEVNGDQGEPVNGDLKEAPEVGEPAEINVKDTKKSVQNSLVNGDGDTVIEVSQETPT